jgi:chemotaxis protein CheX
MTLPEPAAPINELFSNANLLQMDETVKEVFDTMLGLVVSRRPCSICEQEDCVHGPHTAHIGFEGVISGHCEIHLSRDGSAAIASAMLGGAEVDAHSDAVCDAVGELCNMLAGGWKDRLPCLSAECHISVPVQSCDLHTHAAGEEPPHAASELEVSHRSYTFGGHYLLELTLAQMR